MRAPDDESISREAWIAALSLCEATADGDLVRIEEIVNSIPSRALLFTAFIGVVGAVLPELTDQGALRSALLRLRNEGIDTFKR